MNAEILMGYAMIGAAALSLFAMQLVCRPGAISRKLKTDRRRESAPIER